MGTADVPKGINISDNFRAYYVFPSAAYISFPDTGGYITYVSTDDSTDDGTAASRERGWVIHYARLGTSYATIPHYLGPIPPTRLDLNIPDQLDWPPQLWDKLGARDSVHVVGTRINSLGISRHLVEGLECWSSRTKDFDRVYLEQPFGSTLFLRSLTVSPADMEFEIRPNKTFSLPGVLLSAQELQVMWGFDAKTMPPTISYTKLRYERQLANQAILVSLLPEGGCEGDRQQLVFKSSRVSPCTVYHEIKVRLSMCPLRTIVESPKFLVTTDVPGAEPQQRVCGFLTRYYENGTLADALTSLRDTGRLALKQQLGWARDLVSSLIHIQNSPARFYSDLRLDQLVLDANLDGSTTAVLLDLEQGRNIYNWAPPEIYYLEWIAELGYWEFARTDQLPGDVMTKYRAILEHYFDARGYSTPLHRMGLKYDNPPHGWYWPWLHSSPQEQEAGMVYMLGKALWCIFEGIGDADIVLGLSSTSDGGQRFPEFIRTPPALQVLIRACTQGAREWIDGPIKIYRRGGRIFPLGKTGRNGEEEGTAEETVATIKDFWLNEMHKAEAFVAARIRYVNKEATEDDLKLLPYLRRPTLKDVWTTLDDFLA
ncbi:hypothetical protein CMQ_7692 [Grosmannia clavigera kw1407]|uniref:Protein kinase domain-containing protein n=1 Tax=Grosmannia clavigera (strain kw1407 / UAMH 11150) TaxID=655863 RepID=F0XNQ9_GROCL|nr:uncharacterized protein CMQ_7692 [Grosmannia clavigera kw1407]EFX00690.1 hypothetical protein CMQ_7692 [Grosmannia clavigera kw1407]